MSETEDGSEIVFSKEFEVVLDQYKAHIAYARGVGERVIGLFAVAVGVYYAYLKDHPDSSSPRTAIYVWITGICLVPLVYLLLCINNSKRCWSTYRWLHRLSANLPMNLNDLGIIDNEPRWVVWMWYGTFMIMFAVFILAEAYHLVGLWRS